MERPSSIQHNIYRNKKKNCIIDLSINRSIGTISSREFRRRSIINEINHITFVCDKTYKYPSSTYDIDGFVHDNILHMELDPRERKCLITLSRYNNLTIYYVPQDVNEFEKVLLITLPHNSHNTTGGRIAPPNSVHWLWDGTVFSIGLMNSIHFYDTTTCQAIETINMRTEILNHVIAAKKNSVKKYVAATGIEGHVFIIDMHHGIVVLTMKNVEKTPMRAICWHPTKESYYATGNENGNIYLWDLRFQKQFISKLSENNNFSKKSSHPSSVIGLNFYNDGNSIISVDDQGGIKSWETNSGCLRPNYYENIQLNDYNKSHICKNYQFAVTDNLKEDIAFLPSNIGLKILDIENCKLLSNSNDTSFPVHCATYDSKNIRVYGSTNDVVKLWSTQRKSYQDKVSI